MKFPLRDRTSLLEALSGTLLGLLVGLLLLHSNFRLAKATVRSSYNWLFDLSRFLRPKFSAPEMLIIYMDEKSYGDLKQPFNAPWDRALHAQLLDRLSADRPKVVIFDILFTDPGPSPEADQKLADALRKSGRTVLAADYSHARQTSDSQVAKTWTLTPPFRLFETNAAAWGLAQLEPEEDFMIREHYHGPPDQSFPSMTWAAARLLGMGFTEQPEARSRERWINYYGPPTTIPHISYSHALEMPPGYYRNKLIFIGARPIASTFIERRDELRNPYFVWNENFVFSPAVEVQATVLLNLMRGDWLRRLPPAWESVIILCSALLCGISFAHLRPLPAAGAAASGIAIVALAAITLFARAQLWFPWMVTVLGQIPAALLWSSLWKSIDWYVQKKKFVQEGNYARLRIREQAGLLDKARDAIVVQDMLERVIFWNKGAERLYGWTSQECLGKNFNELLSKSPSEKLAEVRNSLEATGEWAGGLVHVTKDKKSLNVESSWSLVRDDHGQPASILVINTDVTEKQLLEAQLLRTQRMESIGTLAGGIAHDLNNVLAPIMMCAQLLEMKKLEPDSAKLLKNILISVDRARDLVKQVLSFARGHHGEHTPLQLNHLVKEMEKMMSETFPKSITVSHRVSPNLHPVQGDATQLHQVVLNLCVNARDAMDGQGAIAIQTTNVTLTEAEAQRIWNGKPGEYVSLSVSDSGTGIPREILDKIFEPFFTTKEAGKGTGLGLSTVLSIVKSHHGFLNIQTEVGKGSTFTVYLPAAIGAVSGAADARAKELPRGKGELILVVDDEAMIRELAQKLLTLHGYRVITALNGTEAVKVLTRQPSEVSLALVDMSMPGLDGAGTIQSLREIVPSLPCIAISGILANDKAKERLAKLEVVCLTKPFSTERLLKAMREKLLSGSPTADE